MKANYQAKSEEQNQALENQSTTESKRGLLAFGFIRHFSYACKQIAST